MKLDAQRNFYHETVELILDTRGSIRESRRRRGDSPRVSDEVKRSHVGDRARVWGILCVSTGELAFFLASFVHAFQHEAVRCECHQVSSKRQSIRVDIY